MALPEVLPDWLGDRAFGFQVALIFATWDRSRSDLRFHESSGTEGRARRLAEPRVQKAARGGPRALPSTS